MPNPRRRGVYERVEYVVVERDGKRDEVQFGGIQAEEPTATVDRILRRSYTRRQQPSPTDVDYDTDDEDDFLDPEQTRTTTTTPTLTIPSGPPAVRRAQRAG